jgi:hypothetical protein
MASEYRRADNLAVAVDPSRDRRILRRLKAGESYGHIAGAMGLTRSVVAGVAHRDRRRRRKLGLRPLRILSQAKEARP